MSTDTEWPAPAPTPAPMSRAERVEEILRLEGLAAAAKRRADGYRSALDEDARAELEREGAAPTWRFPDIGTITLPVSTEAAVVTDPAVFLAWCKQRYPTEVETLEQVRGGFQTVLLGRLVLDEDYAIDPATGEVVPGLTVRPGGQPKTLSFRVASGIKAVYAAYGDAVLDSLTTPQQPGGEG